SKREVKDLEGDPLIRGERRRVRQQFAGRNVRVGIRHAIIAIVHEDQIVGLRYRPGETPVPVVVCKGDGEAGAAMQAEARQLGLPIVDNAAFVTALTARHAVGDTIVPELFQVAAETLVAAGFSFYTPQNPPTNPKRHPTPPPHPTKTNNTHGPTPRACQAGIRWAAPPP